MTSSNDKSPEEELKEIQEELRAMGYNNIGEAYAAMQNKSKMLAKAERDGAKMAGALKMCLACKGVGEKRCTGMLHRNVFKYKG